MTSRASAVLALALALASAATTPALCRTLRQAATAPASTNGTRVAGYTYLTNQADVLVLSPTFCGIVNALVPGDQSSFQSILSMYNESIAPLVSSTNYSSYPLNQILYSGGTFTSAADINVAFPNAVKATTFAKNVTVKTYFDFGSIIFSLLYVAKGKIMVDYLDAALQANQSSVIINNIDRAYAAFVGNTSLQCFDGPFQLMGLGSPLVGKNFHGDAASALYMSKIFGDAQHDVSNATVNRLNVDNILSVYAAFGLQLIRFASYSADLARVCGNAAIPLAAKSRISFIWLITRPLLRGLGATDAALAAFDDAIVETAFNSTTAAIVGVSVNGITLNDMGTPIPSLSKQHWVMFGPTFNITGCAATSI